MCSVPLGLFTLMEVFMPVKRMRFSETIVVPRGRVSVLERARASAIENLGGFTELHGIGGWETATGAVVYDKIAQLTVWSEDGQAAEDWVLSVRDDLFSWGETDVFMASSQTPDSPDGFGTMAGIFSQ